MRGIVRYNDFPKFSDSQTVRFSHPNIVAKTFYCMFMLQKDADRVANNEDPDQTAPLGAPLGAV